MFVSDGLDIE